MHLKGLLHCMAKVRKPDTPPPAPQFTRYLLDEHALAEINRSIACHRRATEAKAEATRRHLFLASPHRWLFQDQGTRERRQ